MAQAFQPGTLFRGARIEDLSEHLKIDRGQFDHSGERGLRKVFYRFRPLLSGRSCRAHRPDCHWRPQRHLARRARTVSPAGKISFQSCSSHRVTTRKIAAAIPHTIQIMAARMRACLVCRVGTGRFTIDALSNQRASLLTAELRCSRISCLQNARSVMRDEWANAHSGRCPARSSFL